MNIFSRSWLLTRLTFGVINKDRELLWFALLSFIFSAMFSAAMIVPSILPLFLEQGISTEALGTLQYVIIFATYFGLHITRRASKIFGSPPFFELFSVC